MTLNRHQHTRMQAKTSAASHFWTAAFSSSGSVLPFAAKISVPASVVAFVVKLMESHNIWGFSNFYHEWHLHGSGFASVTGMLAFFIVFRSSQSYSRYWRGCELTGRMQECMIQMVQAIMAYTRSSKKGEKETSTFVRTVLSMSSLLHALCSFKLSEQDVEEARIMRKRLEIIDGCHLAPEILDALKHCQCKPLMAFYWMRCLVADGISDGIIGIPPPIAGQIFTSLNGAWAAFQDGIDIATVPFPMAYKQVNVWLMVIHTVVAPFVVTEWVERPTLALVFTFIIVFNFWTLYGISEMLENPFGLDDTDIDLIAFHHDFNEHMRQMLAPTARVAAKLVTERHAHEPDLIPLGQLVDDASDDGSSDGHPAERTFIEP